MPGEQLPLKILLVMEPLHFEEGGLYKFRQILHRSLVLGPAHGRHCLEFPTLSRCVMFPQRFLGLARLAIVTAPSCRTSEARIRPASSSGGHYVAGGRECCAPRLIADLFGPLSQGEGVVESAQDHGPEMTVQAAG